MKRVVLSMVAVFVMSMLTAADARAGAKVGEAAPAFKLDDQSGQMHSLGDFDGKIVVLEWFNEGCPYVVKHYKNGDMNKLAEKYADKDVVWLAVNSTSGKSNETNKAIAEKWSIDRPILNDADGKVGKAYGATNTPHMFVIDKSGKIAYMGAIDDNDDADPGVIADSKNHVAAALDALLAGKEVETPQTKAYGCTVKYAK